MTFVTTWTKSWKMSFKRLSKPTTLLRYRQARFRCHQATHLRVLISPALAKECIRVCFQNQLNHPHLHPSYGPAIKHPILFHRHPRFQVNGFRVFKLIFILNGPFLDFSADEPIYEAVLPRDGEVTSPVLPPPVAVTGNKALRPKSPGVEKLQRGTSPQGQRTPSRRSVSPNCASPRHSRPNSRASSNVSPKIFNKSKF